MPIPPSPSRSREVFVRERFYRKLSELHDKITHSNNAILEVRVKPSTALLEESAYGLLSGSPLHNLMTLLGGRRLPVVNYASTRATLNTAEITITTSFVVVIEHVPLQEVVLPLDWISEVRTKRDFPYLSAGRQIEHRRYPDGSLVEVQREGGVIVGTRMIQPPTDIDPSLGIPLPSSLVDPAATWAANALSSSKRKNPLRRAISSIKIDED